MSAKMIICKNHRDRQTPLIFTCTFPGAEYFCPFCGFIGGIFGSGEWADPTPELEAIAKSDKEIALPYLQAAGTPSAYLVEHEGKKIHPRDLPQAVKEANRKIVEDWVLIKDRPFYAGQKVRALVEMVNDLRDEGMGASVCADRGDLLIVRRVGSGYKNCISVSHPSVTDNAFCCAPEEIEAVNVE